MYNFYIHIFSILVFVTQGLSFSNIKIEPDAEFHEKGRSLILKCDATSILKLPYLIYNYKNSNYTLHRIQNSNKYVYIGNLTISNPEQFRVNILCIDSENNEFISSKIYFFGYPPDFLLQGNSKPILTCQDFNCQRIVCCFKPTESELAIKLGFVEERNGNLSISLYNRLFNSNLIESNYNNSCFNIATMAFTPSVQFSLLISNILGHQTFNFSFNRIEIFKPGTPSIFLRPDGTHNVIIDIILPDEGEFLINYTCFSSIDSKVQNNETRTISKQTKITLGGWKPNTYISCSVQSRISLGNEGQGNFSEISIGRTRMPEGIPNSGPFLSPALMNYRFTKTGYLENVVIYFPDLPLTETNGNIIKYQWSCNDCFFKSTDVSNIIQQISRDTRNIFLNKAGLSSELSVAACTTVGCSWSKLYFQTLTDNRPHSRVLLTRNSGKKEVNVIWFLNTQTMKGSDKIFKSTLLYCLTENNLTPSDNECKSIKMIDLNSSLSGRKSFVMEDLNKSKFAFIPSLSGTEFSKIHWNDCIYKDVPIYEVERKLLELKFEDLIKFDVKCDWHSCTIDTIINLPSCQDLPELPIMGILISYDSRVGRKNSNNSVLSNTSFVVQLTDLNLNSNYQSNISLINEKNEIIFWISKRHSTSWLTPTYLALIIVAVVGLLICLAISFFCKLKSMKKQILGEGVKVQSKNGNPYFPAHRERIVEPISLNNVEDRAFNYINEEIYDCSNSVSPERTYSTNMTYSSSQSNESNTDQSTDSSYVSRPDRLLTSTPENFDSKETPAIYAHVIVLTSKGSNTDLNPLRFNEENLFV